MTLPRRRASIRSGIHRTLRTIFRNFYWIVTDFFACAFPDQAAEATADSIFVLGRVRMIPRILHQTSGRMTSEELRLSRRVRSMLPDWEYRFWSDTENDALVGSFFPQYLSAFRKIQRGVVKADIARYMYLSVYGGFYLDTDYKMLHKIDDVILSHACVLPISRSTDSVFRLGNAVLGSEPGNLFWRDFISHIFSETDPAGLIESRVEKVTGPEGLTDFYLAKSNQYKDLYLPPRQMFHPPLSFGGFRFCGDTSTVGVHLCWGSWRSKNVLGSIRRFVHRKMTSF
jgi:mannosyltransferase OCH1-like enzyme